MAGAGRAAAGVHGGGFWGAVDGKWDGLAAGTILEVNGAQFTDGDTWVGGTRTGRVTVHVSFLERYLPVLLPERTMEVSHLRLMVVKSAPQPGLAASGWLRDVSSRTMSQCIITCVFRERNEREVDTARSE